MSQPYLKKPLSISDQIALLESRGLFINDKSQAEHFLSIVSYYRLAGYWKTLQSNPTSHLFNEGSTFETVIDIYNFDRELRFIVFDGLERLEIALRVILVHEMSMSYGPFWYSDAQYFTNSGLFNKNIQKIEGELNRSKEDFIAHHNSVYGSHLPPSWKTMEVLSLGALSKLYSNLSPRLREKNIIAQKVGLPNYVYFESWIQSLTILRNKIAHHSRIWNGSDQFAPKKLQTSPHPWIKQQHFGDHIARLLYNKLCALKFLLNQVSPGHHFSDRLRTLIAKYPIINISKMGFPGGWTTEDLWD